MSRKSSSPGTYIRRPSQFDSPSPLVNVTADDLAAAGANEIGRVLEDLTINTGSQNNPDAFTQNFTTGTSNVNLRGLGVSSTLVLINGRRQTQSAVTTDRGENFVDTSSLPPMIAFERIEVLKDGATALYGSEAVAGVVNFITRSNFEGFDLELALQGNDNYPQQDVQLNGVYGGGNDDTHVLVAFSHLDREPLTTFERRLSGPTDDLSQAGNPGSFLVPSLPGNPAFRSVWTAAFDSNRNGVADFVEPTLGLPAVPGAQPPVFADQNCTAIAAQDPKVVPAISVSVPSPIGAIPIGLCAFDFGGFYSIVPEEQRSSAFAELTHVFGDTLEGRIEAHVADNEALRNNSPSFPFAAFPTVAASHPDNPYGSDVRFIGRIIGAGGVADRERPQLRHVAPRRLADRQPRQHLAVGDRRAIQRERLLRLGARRARRPLQFGNHAVLAARIATRPPALAASPRASTSTRSAARSRARARATARSCWITWSASRASTHTASSRRSRDSYRASSASSAAAPSAWRSARSIAPMSCRTTMTRTRTATISCSWSAIPTSATTATSTPCSSSLRCRSAKR